MFHCLKSLFLCILLIFSTHIHAKDLLNPYVGVDITSNNIKDEVDQYHLASAGLHLGNEFNDYIALETRVGTGFKDDTANVNGIDIDVSLEHYVAGFVKLQSPEYRGLKAHILAGIAQIKIQARALGQSRTIQSTDFAFGAGVSYDLTENTDVKLEYINFNQKELTHYHAVNLGMSYNF